MNKLNNLSRFIIFIILLYGFIAAAILFSLEKDYIEYWDILNSSLNKVLISIIIATGFLHPKNKVFIKSKKFTSLNLPLKIVSFIFLALFICSLSPIFVLWFHLNFSEIKSLEELKITTIPKNSKQVKINDKVVYSNSLDAMPQKIIIGSYLGKYFLLEAPKSRLKN